LSERAISAAPMVMVRDRLDIAETQASIKSRNPDQVVGVRVPTSAGVAQRVVELAREGAEVINLLFDPHGREQVQPHPRHMRDVIREVHGALVRDGARDQVTLISSGGIAMAEHVAKIIICGADAAVMDIPLLLAFECRLCKNCEKNRPCPVTIDSIAPAWGTQRVLNLMSAWRNQLLEILGAMGIREMRRLRGEVGRAMFFEDLEADIFGKIFGERV